MSNTGWRTTIQTGDAASDLRMLEQHRTSAQGQGLVLHSRNLPAGGFEVATAPLGAPSPFEPSPYGAPPYAPAPYAPAPYAAPPFAAPIPAPRFGAPPDYPYQAPAAVPQRDMGSCQGCGRDAQVKHFTFRQNIGALFIRFPKTVSGFLCRHCVERFFWTMTGITLIGGWWGYISFAYSLFAIPANVYNYLTAIGLPEPPDDMASLSAKKTRAIVMVVFGVLASLPAALWMLVSVTLLFSPDPDDVSAGIFNMVVSLLIGLPALALVVFGILKRVKAGARETELVARGG